MLLNYIIFALISTFVNISFQYLSFLIYEGVLALYIAMSIGTISGLISKYFLDKKFVFEYETDSHKDNANKFFLYSLMGVFTTIIFFGFEISFYYFFDSSVAKYIGAILGLSLGYTIKYYLDKKYVFI